MFIKVVVQKGINYKSIPIFKLLMKEKELKNITIIHMKFIHSLLKNYNRFMNLLERLNKNLSLKKLQIVKNYQKESFLLISLIYKPKF